MKEIKISACYCSVFDECYERKEDGTRPKPVDQCTPPEVRFQPTFQHSPAQ